MKEARIHARQMVEKAVLRVGDDALPDIGHQRGLPEVGQPLGGIDGDHGTADEPDRGQVLLDEDVVDHGAQQPRR